MFPGNHLQRCRENRPDLQSGWIQVRVAQLSGLGSKFFDRRVNQKAGDGALHCRRPFFVFYAGFCWVKRIPADSLVSLLSR